MDPTLLKVLVDRKNLYKLYIEENKLKNQKTCVTSIQIYKEDQLQKWLDTVTINQYLEHPNIVKCFYFSLICPTNESYKILKIHHEYFTRGNLRCFIEEIVNNNMCFDETTLIHYATQLLSAFGYMQQLGYCHRNIKAENIFVSEDGANLYIGDFKNCIKTSNDESEFSIRGSELYLSPVVRKAYENFSINYKESKVFHNPYKSDVYSLGLVLYELCSLGKNSEQTIENLENSGFDCNSDLANLYPSINELLKIILVVDEKNRKDFIDIIKIFKVIKSGNYCIQCSKFCSFFELITMDYEDYLCKRCGLDFDYCPEAEIYCKECDNLVYLNEPCNCYGENVHCYICKDIHKERPCYERILEIYEKKEFPLVMYCKSCDIIDMRFDVNKFAFYCEVNKEHYCIVCGNSISEKNHKVCSFMLRYFHIINKNKG